jgi:hypothetical protein
MASAPADRAPFDPHDLAVRLLAIKTSALVETQSDAESLVQVLYDISAAATEALLHEFRALLAVTQLPIIEDSQMTRTKMDMLIDQCMNLRPGAPAAAGGETKPKTPTKDNNWFAVRYGEDEEFRARYPASDDDHAKVKKAERGTPDYFKKLGRAVFSAFTAAQKAELKAFRKETEADQANPELFTGDAEPEEVPAKEDDGDGEEEPEEPVPETPPVKAKKTAKPKTKKAPEPEPEEDGSGGEEEPVVKPKKATKKVTRGAKVPKKK